MLASITTMHTYRAHFAAAAVTAGQRQVRCTDCKETTNRAAQNPSGLFQRCAGMCVLIWEQAFIFSSRERCPEENTQDVCFKNMSIHTAVDEEKAIKREPEHIRGRRRILTLRSFLPGEWLSPSLLTFYSHFPFNKLPCRVSLPAFCLPVLLLLIASSSHFEKMLESTYIDLDSSLYLLSQILVCNCFCLARKPWQQDLSFVYSQRCSNLA